jgi:hypothetical protein
MLPSGRRWGTSLGVSDRIFLVSLLQYEKRLFLVAIDPHKRAIVRRSKVQEYPLARSFLVLEISPVPQRPFVEHQQFALRIPISGNVQRGRTCEVVLDRLCGFGLGQVSCKSAASCLPIRVVQTISIRIDDHVPLAIEAHAIPVIHGSQHRGGLRCGLFRTPAKIP